MDIDPIKQKDTIEIRENVKADHLPIVELYNHYIINTPITFDIQPHTLSQRQAWFGQFQASGPYRLFVAIEQSQVLGYACSTKFKAKGAYRTSVEVSVYLSELGQGRGIGSCLYHALFMAMSEENIHRAYAAITQPNVASCTLHQRFGFVAIGTMSKVGWKFGQYWDVALYEKRMKVKP